MSIAHPKVDGSKASPLRVLTIDGYIATLDARHGGAAGWAFWRAGQTSARYWVFSTTKAINGPELRDESLESLLARAAALPPPLPVYPRRPPAPPLAAPVRGGHKWSCREYGVHNCATRRAAQLAIDGQRERVIRAQEAWDREIGPIVCGKTEGVDFVWSSAR